MGSRAWLTCQSLQMAYFLWTFQANCLKIREFLGSRLKKVDYSGWRFLRDIRRLETRVRPYEMSRIWGQMIYTFMKDTESLMIFRGSMRCHSLLPFLSKSDTTGLRCLILTWQQRHWKDSKLLCSSQFLRWTLLLDTRNDIFSMKIWTWLDLFDWG